jgi:L-lysine 6-transaminase
MVRFQRILEVIEEEDLVKNCELMGKHLLLGLNKLSEKYPDKIFSCRGLGLFVAFDTKDADMRTKIINESVKNGMLILGCGARSIRFRPPITVKKEHIDEGIRILDKVISQL